MVIDTEGPSLAKLCLQVHLSVTQASFGFKMVLKEAHFGFESLVLILGRLYKLHFQLIQGPRG